MSYLTPTVSEELAEHIANDKQLEATDSFFYAGFLACLYSLVQDAPEEVSEAYLRFYEIATEKNTEELSTGPYIAEETAKSIGNYLATCERVIETENEIFYAGFMAGIYSLAEKRPRPIADAYLRYYALSVLTCYMKRAHHEN